MSQLAIARGRICGMPNDSQIEPDPAVMLEVHAIVSLVHVMWA